jgi:hypothetical protein
MMRNLLSGMIKSFTVYDDNGNEIESDSTSPLAAWNGQAKEIQGPTHTLASKIFYRLPAAHRVDVVQVDYGTTTYHRK